MNKRVLVTGGAGFIGSHTVDGLIARGYDVRILDSLQPRVHPRGKPEWIPPEADFRQGDVRDARDLAEALDGVNYLIHLAAYQDYLPDFSTFVSTNTESTARIFELIVADRKRYPIQKIVFASSQSVSGEGKYVCPECTDLEIPSIADQLARVRTGRPLGITGARTVVRPRPAAQLAKGDWEVRCDVCGQQMRPVLIDESTIGPGTTYAISKYAIELLADRLGRRYEIATACMRYTYVQGPRNSFYNAYSGIARRFALLLMNGRAPVVYEDGRQLRDYVNVLDVAKANILALEDERANYGVFNVGGGRAVTVIEFAEMMISAFGSSHSPSIGGQYRVGDTRHTVSDNSLLHSLGWQPTFSVEQNVQQYVEWIRDQKGTREFLDEAERVMASQGVVQSVKTS